MGSSGERSPSQAGAQLSQFAASLARSRPGTAWSLGHASGLQDCRWIPCSLSATTVSYAFSRDPLPGQTRSTIIPKSTEPENPGSSLSCPSLARLLLTPSELRPIVGDKDALAASRPRRCDRVRPAHWPATPMRPDVLDLLTSRVSAAAVRVWSYMVYLGKLEAIRHYHCCLVSTLPRRLFIDAWKGGSPC